jgi:ABC-type polar amino acid transport system ATPase subunit
LHLDVRQVIALARASAIPKVQKLYDGVTIGSAIDPKLEDESN